MNTETTGRAPLLHIADLVLNRPLLLTPDKALVIADVLAGRIGIESPLMVPEASRFYGRRQARPDGGDSYLRVDEGVAIITIDGSLVNRGAWIGASSGLTSYEGLSAQLAEVAQRDDVKALILDVNSPGGEAGGVHSLGVQLRALRETKCVVAVVNDTACSGAYWIAAQASEIVISETSSVGSIGVIVLHLNRAGELAQKGIAPTLVMSGDHKADGHSLGPLPEAVKAEWKSTIDAMRSMFAAEVAAGRGEKLTAAAALETEARIFYGRAAIKAGLADKVGTFEAALADLKRRRPLRAAATTTQPTGKGTRMSAENENTITAEAHATAVTEATKAGATAERGRIKAIMTCEAAAERPALARQIALETDLAPEAAATILGATAVETKPGIKSLAERAKETAEPGMDAGATGAAPGGNADAQVDAEARRKRVIARVSGGAR